MEEKKSHNERVIEEFRASGEYGGLPEGWRLLLLTTTGFRSGRRYTTPLGYITDGERLVVTAHGLGRPNNPAWYHNLVAHPEVRVETSDGIFDTEAVVAEGAERDRLWRLALEMSPSVEDPQANLTRRIPVVVLQRQEA